MSNSKNVQSHSNQSFDRLWLNILTNPTDFNQWTYLLQYCEHMKNITLIRKAYNKFLYHYPLCYIYWQKFADYELEYSNGKEETAFDVLERAVTAFPLSVSLWLHYLKIVIKFKSQNEKDILSLFERAIDACGHDFNCSDIWELYISWLSSHRDLSEVTRLYDQLLQTPTFKIKKHMENFISFVNDNNPICIISKQEYNSYNSKDILCANDSNVDIIKLNLHGIGADININGQTLDSTNQTKSEENLVKIKMIRLKIIEKRMIIYNVVLRETEERIKFEENIKRPYFHVNPLDLSQLNNWMAYIDWVITKHDNNNHKKVIHLFERCLISCALYEHMWMRYANYLIEKRNINCIEVKLIKDVFKRACEIHVRKSLKLHYLWSLFEEKEGNFKEALSILEKFETENSNVIEISLYKINLHLRNGDLKTVDTLFKSAIEKAADNSKLSSHLSVKYSRFCLKILKDAEAANRVLYTALKNDPTNHNIYLQLIDIEYQQNDFDYNKIEILFDEAIEAVNSNAKLSMIQRKLEFIQDFGFSSHKIQATISRLQNMMHGFKDKDKHSDDCENSFQTKNVKKLKITNKIENFSTEVLHNCNEFSLNNEFL